MWILLFLFLLSSICDDVGALVRRPVFKMRGRIVPRRSASYGAKDSSFALGVVLESTTMESSEYLEKLRSELMAACDRFREEQKKQWDLPSLSATNTSSGIFGSQSRAEDSVVLNNFGEEVLKLVDKITNLNPTSDPLKHWKSEEGNAQKCMLDGMWKLRFTTAADATFKPGKRGPAFTLQRINATDGTLTNIIEFRENNGTLRNFNVVVEGDALSRQYLELDFKKVVINREPRRWLARRLFKKFTIPLPNFGFLERITRRKDKVGERRTRKPGFEVLYLDDELRIHRTNQGQVFVQSRLYDVWDPTEDKGWKLISAI